MLYTLGQVGSLKSSPIESTPRDDRKIPIGDPMAKRAVGWNSSFGYLTLGCPVPADPRMNSTVVLIERCTLVKNNEYI